ncbi:MAG: hypothetical protein KDB27_29505, partial [Planctomycetales bacterium]|nr:hypothetical protein [Planctomycetales bacterium]
ALAPGGLTTAHAQILNRKVSANRCSACHAAGDDSLADWLVPLDWRHPSSDEALPRSQSRLCLHCHENSFDRLTALAPHGITVNELKELTDQAAVRSGLKNVAYEHSNGSKEIACSVCHKEHHGAMHNLSALTNKQCSTCHVENFHQFDDHPEFQNWPHRRRTRIAFDHTSHQFKHFVKDNKTFECQSCHVRSGEKGIRSVVSFESCQACHEATITSPSSDGIAFFSIPSIDVEAFRDAGIDVGAWPDSASGDFDGGLPPAMRMMLESDPKARAALRQFDAPFDFLDVDRDDPAQLAAASQIVFGIKRLMQRLALPDTADSIDTNEIADLVNRIQRVIPPSVIEAAVHSWMTGQSAPRVGQVDKRHIAESPADGSSAVQPAAFYESAGPVGWFRDDDALSIGYRPIQHDDPVMTALYDTLATHRDKLGAGGQNLFEDLRQPTTTGHCASCHSIDRHDDRAIVNWYGKQPKTKREFTKFSHSPHLILPQLGDCSACHQLNEQADTTKNYASSDPAENVVSNFANISKEACANCHSPKAAGESCLKCHNYHIESDFERLMSVEIAETPAARSQR